MPNFNGDRPSMALDSSALTPGRVVVAYDGKTNTMMALTVLKMPRLVEDVVYGRSWVVDAHNHAGGTSPRRLVDLGVPTRRETSGTPIVSRSETSTTRKSGASSRR